MKKGDCIRIFNAMIRGTPVSFKKDLIPAISDYLTENNIKDSDKVISSMINNPDLIQMSFPKVVDYYCRKYNILSIKLKNNNQTILYYE